MNTQPLVSVIIPVYNVENYLVDCLDSVCNQTYSSLEIIVVDDESPDNSGKIVDEYAVRDNRIKALHIKNSGAAGARNRALDVCKGEYIMFVDSDDWLEDNAIEVMMTKMLNNSCDMVLCQYFDEFTNKSEKHTFLEKSYICSDMIFIKDMIKKWEYIINSNKIYKASAINTIRFVEGRCIDDEFFTYKAVMNMKTIYISDEYLYHYRMRKSSAMGDAKKQNQRHIDQVDFVTERYVPLSKAYPELIPNLLNHIAEVLMSVMRNSAGYPDTFIYAKNKLKYYSKKILFNKSINSKIKKSIIMYLFKPQNELICSIDVNKNQLQENYFD